ncbi:hypothetical protein UA08_09495 [Talaromyces atroroseus]|uniref:ABC transporter domain-containing protein n=1 Tax=Talaromyces atroroseus TaxID=1441469 RepID=A0A1Q5Q6E6_TALAT|nr:hypothetical protein UA08_09495 [Talaromyces atroroseus]OKL55220.1 hypothetical protein UA08_09495 [Talaromyces atroroseus]
MDLSRDFHDTKNPGELRQLLAYGTALGELLNLIAFSLIPTMVELLIAIYILFIRFGLYMAMTNLLTILLFSWSSHKFLTRQKVKLEEWDAAQENQEKVLYEAVTNWLTVTYFNRVNREKDRYLRTVQNLSRAGNRYKHWADLKAMVNQGILKAGYACACLIVLSQIHQEQKSSDIVLVATNWRDLISPFQKLDSLAESFNTKFTDARRIILLLKRAPSVQDQAHAASLSLEAPGSVQFNKITFAYPGRPQNVLQQISFECQAGKTTAIVGKTGSGKTTIFNLILRQFDPDGGAVMINQQDVRTVTIDSIRESIGIVPQDAILFNASIEYNLQYANPNASQDDIEKACTEVHLHHWIQSLPDGYKTIVGDKGLKLSGGERQRLSIAQVILKNPKILLLDEATSSVDYETERVIQGAFEKLMSGRTVIVIAHRLPTVRHANRIIVLKGAKISDQGTHAELMSRAGYYRDVLNRNGLLVSSTNDEKTVSS